MSDTQPANSPLMPWVDLEPHGAKLSIFRFPDGRMRIVLTGVKDGSEQWRWAEAQGYVATTNRLSLYTDNTMVSPRSFLGPFPKGRLVSVSRNELIRVVSPDNARSIRAANELRAAKVMGLNYLGQTVWEGVAGRFIRPEGGGQPINERESQAALFLRAKDDDAMALCADGLVETMVRGEVLRSGELRRFAGVIFGGPGPVEATDGRLRGVQEAVEAAMQRRLEKEARRPDRAAFDLAVAMTERQPPFVYRTSSSVENQQYSTVLPLAVVAQRLLGPTQGKSVLEPTIGNGSLVSLLPDGADITGVEIDPARVSQVGRLREGMSISVGDFTKIPKEELPEVDAVIANPPFGGLFPNVDMHGLRVSRLDHLILMKALEARKDQGRAVFIIGADRENLVDSKAGLIAGVSKSLFNWLADHYELPGVAEIDGRLYEKMGAGYPVRLVVVGDRRSPEVALKARQTKEFRLPERLPVLRSWDEVWAFSEALVHKAPGVAEPEEEAATAADEMVAPVEAVAPEIPVEVVTEAAVEPDHTALRMDNSYQTPYVPASQIGEATAMIPRNMQGPVSKALDELEQNYGTVDEFVASKLQMTLTDLGEAFSPEQIDAVALSIARIDEARGFIIGDQTGLGKGRQVAAMARYAALSRHHAVFVTEKPNLFSDLWRDIQDICVDMDPHNIFRPLILNDGVNIKDGQNKVVFPAARKEEVKRLLADNIHPAEEGYTITFATYSQFNRELAKSLKAGWLGKAAKDSLVLLDESHNAAGASNTAENLGIAVEDAWGCIYSSATFAKNAKNMAAYAKVFPATISMEELPDILAVGGEPLLEILAANLAEDGTMIRREHDLSNLTFETLNDDKYYDRNRELADRLSEILLAMSHLSGDVNRMAKALNKEMRKDLDKLSPEQRKGNRMGVSSMNFGSRLYTILRQFQLAIKVDVVADDAIEQLSLGRKPVIVTEQTMESLLAETLFGINDEQEESAETEVVVAGAMEFDGLTFRDVLSRVLDKIDVIVERDDYGSVSRTTAVAKAENEEQAKAWERAKENIFRLIAAFPDLPVSPLDSIRERITAAGFTCGEISGRKFQINSLKKPIIVDGVEVVPASDGKITVTPRPDDRLKTIHGFNHGQLDAVILTKAGSTGISLHSSEKFEDQRQRVMVELQIANNVAERMQFFGRVNRKGQVNAPIIKTVSSGLPCEMRVLAMQNVKLRRLSANCQSNRESAAETKEIADILNPFGNEVVYRFLENNPTVAETLDIKLDQAELEAGTDEIYFVNKLTGRIALLPIADQEEILDLITTEFTTSLADLDKLGENPFKAAENDWGARVVARELYDGAENPNASVFERPVYLTTLQWEEEVVPMAWEAIEADTLHGIEELASDGRVAVGGEPVNGFPRVKFDKLADEVKALFMAKVEELIPMMIDPGKGLETLTDFLNAKDPNSVQATMARRDFLVRCLRDLIPGQVVNFTGEGGETLRGMVTQVVLPDQDKYLHLLGKYEVKIAVPGERKPQVFSFYGLQRNGYSVQTIIWREVMEQAFRDAPAGQVVRNRMVLDGNLFRAAQIAATGNLGRSGIYTDAEGNRQRAIILRCAVDMEAIKNAPPRVALPAQAATLLHTERDLTLMTTPMLDRSASATFRALPSGELVITVPGTKQTGGKLFLDDKVRALVGDFAGNRSQMTARVPLARAGEVMQEVYRIYGGLYAPPKLRDRINQMQALPQAAEKPVESVGMAA